MKYKVYVLSHIITYNDNTMYKHIDVLSDKKLAVQKMRDLVEDEKQELEEHYNLEYSIIEENNYVDITDFDGSIFAYISEDGSREVEIEINEFELEV